MKAKTLLIGLMTAFTTVLAACGGGNNSSKVPSIPSSSVPTPSPSTPTPSVSTPTPSVSTPAPSVSTPTPSVSTPTPSVSTPTPSVSTPDVDPDPTPDPIVPDTPVEGNLFVATGWEEADELQADVNEGANIVYWADTNWSGSLVTATTSVEDGIFSIDSTLASGSCWHGLQAFINVPNNAAGDEYDVSLTINSSVAGKITFNGQVVDLVEGRNDLSAHVKLASANRWDGVAFVTAPISIQFGVEGAAADANAVVQNGEYKLYNIVVLKTTSVTPDPEPENPTPDVPTEGNLFVADGWQEGEELTADENEGEKIIYWADTNWTGSLVTATTSVEDGVFKIDGTQVSGYCWHGLQAFINVPNNAAGDTYNVSLTLKSSVAGQIHFNGQVVDLVVGNNELTSTVTVIATNRWDGAPYITAPVSIQFGAEQANQDANKAMQNGEYELSNIVIEKATGGSTTPDTPNPEPENPTPDNPVVPEPGDLKGLFTVIANATIGAANNYTIKWNDAAYAVTQPASITDCTVSPGIVVNLEYFTVAGDGVTFNIITGADVGRVVSIVLHTAQGDYKVSMRLDGNTYADYTVEKVDCTHSSSGEPSEPTEVFAQTSGQFNYSGEAGLGAKEFAWWNQRAEQGVDNGQTIATYDAETNTFTYNTVSVDGPWWADQFFYKVGESGQVKVSFTITVTGFEGTTGSITINGQVYEITNGVALDVEFNTFNATTISIQLGAAAGDVNLYGTLSVTFTNMSIIK